MSISKRIIASRNGISEHERINISYKLYEYILTIDSRKNDMDFLKLIPTLIVASNESFFKETISDLVDFDQIYLEKSKDLIKKNNIKPDLIDIFHVAKQKITIGNIVAYSLKYSSFESIYSNLCLITSLDVFSLYEKSPISIVEYLDLIDEIIDGIKIDKSRIFKNLSEVYELRHSICHDFLDNQAKKNLNFEKIKEYLIDNYLMQVITSMMISEHIYMPNIEINFPERIKEKLDLIQELNEQIEKRFNEDKQKTIFAENIQSFMQYLHQDCIAFGSFFKTTDFEDVCFKSLVYEHKLQLLDFRIKLLNDNIESLS